jgi:hypothetical protein
MMPAKPMPSFKMIEAKIFFHLSIIEFNAPAPLCNGNNPANFNLFGTEPSKPIFRGCFFTFRPFDQQQLSNPVRMILFAPTMRSPDFNERESRFLGAADTLPPFNFSPKVDTFWAAPSFCEQANRYWDFDPIPQSMAPLAQRRKDCAL